MRQSDGRRRGNAAGKDSALLTLMNNLGCHNASAVELPEDWNGVVIQTVGRKEGFNPDRKWRNLAEVVIPAYGFLTLKRGHEKSSGPL